MSRNAWTDGHEKRGNRLLNRIHDLIFLWVFLWRVFTYPDNCFILRPFNFCQDRRRMYWITYSSPTPSSEPDWTAELNKNVDIKFISCTWICKQFQIPYIFNSSWTFHERKYCAEKRQKNCIQKTHPKTRK